MRSSEQNVAPIGSSKSSPPAHVVVVASLNLPGLRKFLKKFYYTPGTRLTNYFSGVRISSSFEELHELPLGFKPYFIGLLFMLARFFTGVLDNFSVVELWSTFD